MSVQRIKAADQIVADRGRVALRYGPLIYNIESVDQNVDSILRADAPLTTEWRPDLLGGVMVIKGAFADGQPLLAIPNCAASTAADVRSCGSRTNRIVAGGHLRYPPNCHEELWPTAPFSGRLCQT